MTETACNFRLFVLGNLVTFLCIALLQWAEGTTFFLFLLAMHSGIIMLIVSKKRFMAHDPSVKQFYDRAYLYLGLYVPLLLYKLVGYFFPGVYSGTIASVAITCVIVISVAGSTLNVFSFYGYLHKEPVTYTP
jgi:hypothetical protein